MALDLYARYEHILNDIVHLVPVAYHSRDDAIDAALIPAHEVAERICVTIPAHGHQCGVRVFSGNRVRRSPADYGCRLIIAAFGFICDSLHDT